MYVISEEALGIDSEEWRTSGTVVIIATILTCGLYLYYWLYKMGKVFATVNGDKDNSVLYIILGIFGLSLISMCIIQDDINRLVDGDSTSDSNWDK